MGAFGIWQWIIILAIVLILFARPGKISNIMGDFGKGMSRFRSGLKESDGDEDVEDVEVIDEMPASSPKKKTAKKKSSKKKKSKAKSGTKTR